MQQRQPHTHATCGFCLHPKIIRSKPHETKSGQPICPECLDDWNKCFPPVDDGKLFIYNPSINSTNRSNENAS